MMRFVTWLRYAVLVVMVFALSGCVSLFDSTEDPPTGLSHFGNYLAGRYAGAVNDTAQAAYFYQRALVDRPDNLVIRDRAFSLQLASGNFDDTIVLARDIIRQFPSHGYARLVLALVAVKQDRIEQAKSHIEKMEEGPFMELVGTLVMGWLEVKPGDLAVAYATLGSLAGADNFEFFRHYQKALIADMGDDPAEADLEYQTADELSQQSFPRLIELYGGYLERAGKTDDAAALYASFLEGTPEHAVIKFRAERLAQGQSLGGKRGVDTIRDGLAEVFYMLGLVLSDEAGAEAALPFLHMALYLKPKLDFAQMLLSEAYETRISYAEANEVLSTLGKSSPFYSSAMVRYAFNLNRLDDPEQAKEVLLELIKDDENAVTPVVALADVLRMHEDYAAASESYARAIEIASKEYDQLWSLYYARGISYERIRLWPQAEKDFLTALELFPDHPLVLNYLGYSWIEQKTHLKEAMAMIQKAVNLRPNDGYIIDSLGWAHYQLENYEEAAVHLERAVEMQPDDATINDHLGDAYWQTGRLIEARFQWSHALVADPDEELRERIVQKLDLGLRDNDDMVQTTAREKDS